MRTTKEEKRLLATAAAYERLADPGPDGCRASPCHPALILPVEWVEEPIGRHHDRKKFHCGTADLNEDLARYARQNHESGDAKTFVAVTPEG